MKEGHFRSSDAVTSNQLPEIGHGAPTGVSSQGNTPYSKMEDNKLFFCLHVKWPSLPHFHFKILLYFIHVDEAKRAN